MVTTFKRHGTPHPGVIFNVFLKKLKPILTIFATDELPKRGSLRQNTHFYGQSMPKMVFSLSPAQPYCNAPWADGTRAISDARGSSGARTSLTPLT